MAAGEREGPAINIYGPNESLALTLTLFTEQEASGGHGVAQPSLWVLTGEPGLGWPQEGHTVGSAWCDGAGDGGRAFRGVAASHNVPEQPGEPDTSPRHGDGGALG